MNIKTEIELFFSNPDLQRIVSKIYKFSTQEQISILYVILARIAINKTVDETYIDYLINHMQDIKDCAEINKDIISDATKNILLPCIK